MERLKRLSSTQSEAAKPFVLLCEPNEQLARGARRLIVAVRQDHRETQYTLRKR